MKDEEDLMKSKYFIPFALCMLVVFILLATLIVASIVNIEEILSNFGRK